MSTKPAIATKVTGDSLSATEFNQVVDYFLEKPDFADIPDKVTTEAHIADIANPHGVTKAQVGLGSVDNTADTAKPVSTAQQAALNLKADIASPTFTGIVGGITKTMVGLGNVDNTTDLAKPVSTATQTALDAKQANLVSGTNIKTINGSTVLGSGDLVIAPGTSYTHPNHSGDVTSVGDGATTIVADAVNNSKLANMATKTYKGRTTAATGDPEDVPVATLKADLALNNVDNTSDLAKPISTATQTALDGKEASFSKNTAFNKNFGSASDTVAQGNDVRLSDAREWSAGTVSQIDAEVGTSTSRFAFTPQRVFQAVAAWWAASAFKTKLDGIAIGANNYIHPNHSGDVTSTGDGATSIALNSVNNIKLADMATATLKGRNTAGTGDPEDLATTTVKTMLAINNVDNTSDANKPVSTAQQTALNLKANLASPTFTGTVGGITKTMVGLSAVDNTADSAKPVSTAQQTALNLKANIASPTFTGTVAGITKSMVGLGSVDNTSDAAKPISTATQTALDLKAPLASPALTGVPSSPTPALNTNTTQVANTAFVVAEIEDKFQDEIVLFNDAQFELITVGLDEVISIKESVLANDPPVITYEPNVEGLRKLGSDVKAQTMFMDISKLIAEPIMVDGRLYLLPVNVRKAESITKIGYFLVSGTYTADNENRVGLYEANTDGSTLTLVASSANDGTHWSSGTGWKTKTLSAGYTVDPAKLYYVGVLWNASATTTAPKMAGVDYNLLFSYFDSMLPTNRSWARFIASTTLSSSITTSATTRSVESLFVTLH